MPVCVAPPYEYLPGWATTSRTWPADCSFTHIGFISFFGTVISSHLRHAMSPIFCFMLSVQFQKFCVLKVGEHCVAFADLKDAWGRTIKVFAKSSEAPQIYSGILKSTSISLCSVAVLRVPRIFLAHSPNCSTRAVSVGRKCWVEWMNRVENILH